MYPLRLARSGQRWQTIRQGKVFLTRNKDNMDIYEVGKPFPGPVLKNDGAIFEIGPDGDMILLIQFQQSDDLEKAALKQGFYGYSYGEYEATMGDNKLTIASWVFKFPDPVNYVDAPFHAGLYKDDRIAKFLEVEERNALSLYILDGNILTSIRYIGLWPHAMTLFRNTIKTQMSEKITMEGYNEAVDWLFKLSSKEMYKRGRRFSHKDVPA